MTEPDQPAPGERWRTGSHVGRTIYRHFSDGPERGEFIGVMDTRELAEAVVAAVNHRLLGTGHRWEYGVEGRWPDGAINLDWRQDRDAAEDALAARGRIEGNVVESRLVRRLHTVGPVEGVVEDA